VEDIVAGVVRAIGIYSRVRYATLVELLDGHVDASRKAVAAVVIRKKGYIYAHRLELLDNGCGRSEAWIT
jgi:hypothetical protein